MATQFESFFSEPSLSRIADVLPQIVCATQSDGRARYFNRRWYEYTGLTPEQSLESPWNHAVHPDDLKDCEVSWKQGIAAGRKFQVESRIRDFSGQYHWFLGHSCPSHDDNGGIACWIGVYIDIDSLKKSQEELKLCQERFRLLVESEPQLLWICDQNNRISYVNQQYRIAFDQARKTGAGKHWINAVHPDSRETVRRLWEHALRTASPFEVEVRMLCGHDRAYRWQSIRATSLHDELGQGVQWVGRIHDIEEQRRHAEKVEAVVSAETRDLQRVNGQLEEFAAIASHELQEPLRKIQALSERLQAKCGSRLDDQGREYLKRIIKSVSRMSLLISHLLKFSRASSAPVEFAPVNLIELAKEVVHDLGDLIDRARGRVEIGWLPTIEADPVQMRQLLTNLLSNGLKFHRPDVPPVVKISAREAAGPASPALLKPTPAARSIDYEIAVEDQGIGFDVRDLGRILQTFQRLHGRREFEGTGLGLAICRKIVERHHGQITARSEPGIGSTFLITLPAKQPEARARPAGDPPLHQ